MFHKHKWKEIARTYAKSIAEQGVHEFIGFLKDNEKFGQTTILFKCQDKSCQKLRTEEMLGKEVNKYAK